MDLLTPDLRLARVEDITAEYLLSKGFNALILDIDNTIVSRATGVPSGSVLEWIEDIKQAGISCCLLTNNWHRHVFDFAASLEMPIVAKAMKPLPFAYIKALVTIGAHRENTVVVGDQLITDILGARLCVLPTILVEPLSTTDLWYTKIFRKIEKQLLKT